MSIFAVTSGSGGAGKSCIAAYTAAAMAQAGKKVLLVEAGAGYRSLDLILGAQEKVLFDCADALAGRCNPPDTVLETPYHKNLFLLPGPVMPSGTPPDPAGLLSLLQGSASNFDDVIVDGIDFRVISPKFFHTILLVLTPDSLSIRAAARHAGELYALGAERLRLIINNAPVKVMPMYGARDFDDVIDLVGAQLLGVVPHSPVLQFCANNAEQLPADTLTVDIFSNIAERLHGKNKRLLVQ